MSLSHRLGLSIALRLVLLFSGCSRESSLLAGVGVAWIGHEEIAVDEHAGTLTPVLFGTTVPMICLSAPPTLDTSGWQARLVWRVAEGEEPDPTSAFTEPSRRMASTACWAAPMPPPPGRVMLCGELRDVQIDSTTSLPCRTMHHDLTRATVHRASRSRFEAAWGAGDKEEIVERFDEVARDARKQGFFILATYADMVVVHYLIQVKTPLALVEARSRLAALPAWLDRPEVDTLAGQAATQRARLALAVGWQLARAWEDLRVADQHHLRVADPLRIVVPEMQAGLLARLGASSRAVAHLGRAIQDCGESVCDPFFITQARAASAFWTLLDPTADQASLEDAEASLEQALAQTPATLPGGRANHLINLGLARVRLRGDVRSVLEQARALLRDKTEIGAARAAELSGWADLLEGTAALGEGKTDRALALCAALARLEPTPRLTAWGLDCAAQAHRQRRHLGAAAAAYERLFDYHQYATPQALGQDVPLGPGQRADAFYRAVRVAVERGQPDEAWALLDRLDSLSASESARRACREQLTDPALIEAWKERDRGRAELSRQLRAFDAPVSGRRRRQQNASVRAARAKLDELARVWPGCVGAVAPARTVARGTELRAIAVEDEVLVLRRNPAGEITVDHRTPVARHDLRGDIEVLAAALEERVLTDDLWRARAMRVARAVVPRHPERLEGVVTFGLYGLLQGVPLAALPLPGMPGRWLSEVILPVVLPVGVPVAARDRPATAMPLFVIDPTRDLSAAANLATFYGERFPTARRLRGGAATRQALLEALPLASFLHVDAHVTFDNEFPSLSSFELADGPFRLLELDEAEFSLAFANLSACDSGRWPVTADRGRFGLGGRLARAGVPWVIASRASLDDRLAGTFNRAFYESLSAGVEVPTAFAAAMAIVRGRFSASTWGAMQLLHGPAEASDERFGEFFAQGGQTGALATPETAREMRTSDPHTSGTSARRSSDESG